MMLLIALTKMLYHIKQNKSLTKKPANLQPGARAGPVEERSKTNITALYWATKILLSQPIPTDPTIQKNTYLNQNRKKRDAISHFPDTDSSLKCPRANQKQYPNEHFPACQIAETTSSLKCTTKFPA